MVKEKEVMEKITQVGDDEECSHPNLKDWQFVLLLRVIQADGQPLPVEEFTSWAVVQMICEATGVMPKGARDTIRLRSNGRSRGTTLYNRGIPRGTGFKLVGRTSYQDRWHDSSLLIHTRDSERMEEPERTVEMVGTRTMMIEGEPTDVSTTND